MWRCIQCGDVIDPVILERRIFSAYPHRPTGFRIFAWIFNPLHADPA